MRKLYKNMIFELLETLHTVASQAKNLFAKKDTNTLINLLADCQDCANQIGELIAEFEGSEHITISYLREYCELLYKISLEADKTDSDINIKKELRKQLSKIRNSIENDIKTTIEMVFFPYKASMFDALESIWLAAKDDPDCDAYVVPIPYYDRNPDHSFGKMHYEGGEYPDYVPVVDWQKYNVEERRPDVIFVHNPYDEGNYVTSVHPDFYSKRLREFTDCLCYIPYFVVTNDDLDEHFATNAGCVYAHKVFVQSDKVRDLYIEYFKKNFGNRYGKAEDKFFALGSPKFDKIINTKKEDCKLPDKWRQLIEKPDGTCRKVIFYNTSLSTMLQNSEQYLKKLRHVLEMFRENDDVVLWWRPHPLMEQTFDSMRPQLAWEFRKVVREYKIDGFGIYDDTSDLHRAIAWSDAYYGDASSVVPLCQMAGSPILIQRTDILANAPADFASRIKARALSVTSKKIYITDYCTPGVFVIDKEDFSVQCIICECGLEHNYYNFANAIPTDDEIVFTPFYSNALITYSLDSNISKHIDFGGDSSFCRFGKYAKGIKNKEVIWYIPFGASDIMRFDITSHKIEYVNINGAPGKHYSGFIKDSKLYLGGYTENIVTILDLNTLDCKTEKIEESDSGFRTICSVDDCVLWLTHISKPELYRLENGKSRKFILEKKGKFICGVVGSYVYLFAATQEKVMKFNVKTEELTDITYLFEKEPYNAYSVYFSDIEQEGNTLWVTNKFRGTLYKFDAEIENVEPIKLVVPKNAVDYYKTSQKDIFAHIPHENELNRFTQYEAWGFHDLQGYVEALISETEFAINTWKNEKENANENISAGKRIWGSVKTRFS